MSAYSEIWATRGVRAWAEEWWSMPVEVGDLLARIEAVPLELLPLHLALPADADPEFPKQQHRRNHLHPTSCFSG